MPKRHVGCEISSARPSPFPPYGSLLPIHFPGAHLQQIHIRDCHLAATHAATMDLVYFVVVNGILYSFFFSFACLILMFLWEKKIVSLYLVIKEMLYFITISTSFFFVLLKCQNNYRLSHISVATSMFNFSLNLFSAWIYLYI